MKTNLLPLLACLCLLVLTAACDKKETPAPETEPESLCLLSRVEEPATYYVSEPYDHIYTYTYDTNGRLQTYSFVGNSTHLFNYDKEKLVRQVYTVGSQQTYEYLTFYNAQGMVAKQEMYALGINYTNGRNFLGAYNYSYSNKVCTEVQYFSGTNTTTTPNITWKYTYTGNLLTKVDYLASNGLGYSILVGYDGKTNPLPASYPLLIREGNTFENPLSNFLRRQNITSYTILENDGVTVFKDGSYTATYTYNEQGLPTEQVRTFANGKTDSRRYYYTCE